MASAKSKDRFIMTMGLLLTIIALGGAFAMGDYTLPPEEVPEGEGDWVTASYTAVFDDSVVEGESKSEGIVLDEKKVTSVSFVLTWEDEPDQARHTNTPDTLRLEVESELGSDSDENSAGKVEFTFTAPEGKPWDMKGLTWNATVTAVTCGDQEPLIPDPLGLRTVADGGNSFKLEVEIQYLTKETKGS